MRLIAVITFAQYFHYLDMSTTPLHVHYLLAHSAGSNTAGAPVVCPGLSALAISLLTTASLCITNEA